MEGGILNLTMYHQEGGLKFQKNITWLMDVPQYTFPQERVQGIKFKYFQI